MSSDVMQDLTTCGEALRVLFADERKAISTLDHVRLQERRFLAATRRGTLVRIPGASHMVSLAQPVAFTTLLVDAINSARPAIAL